MDWLKGLFDYQRFAQNDKLQRQIDSVLDSYLGGAQALDDEVLDVSAAGDADAARADSREGKPHECDRS